METRLLSNSSLLVSRLGLGLAALGRPGYINLGHADDLEHDYDTAAMEAHCHAVLDAAWQLGIRYFGRSYAEVKKVNWKDGMKALWYVFKFRFRRWRRSAKR